MGAFFHAVRVFGDQLAAVRWQFIALALGLHLAQLALRAVAWREILSAAYPGERIRFLSVFGAYVAGVGVNSIVPARGGDVVKLYLIKHRITDSTYATLAPTLVAETLFDVSRRGRADHLGALDRRAADAPGLLAAALGRLGVSSLEHWTLDGDRARRCSLRRVAASALIVFVENGGDTRRPDHARVRDRAPAAPRSSVGVIVPAGALLGAADRLALLLPRGVPRPRDDPQRAARARRRFARDALPGHAGRRRARSRG